MDILQGVGIKLSVEDVFCALSTREGVAAWWATNTKGESKVGGVLQFRFSTGGADTSGADMGGIDMKILELRPAQRVLWQVVDGPKEWIGTKVRFELKQDGEYSMVHFKHEDWKEPVDFMHHCSTKWAIYLMSRKSLVKTGKGTLNPNDVRITSWD